MSRARDVASNNLALINPTSDGTLMTASSGAWVSQAPATAPPAGNQVQLTASGTLANGDPVILNANGTVSAVAGTQGGAAGKTAYTQSNVSYNSGCFHVGQNKVMVAYRDSTDSGKGKLVAGTVNASNNTITFGTAIEFDSNPITGVDICYDSANQFVHICWLSTGNQYANIRAYGFSGSNLVSESSATTVNGTQVSAHARITYDAYYDQLVVGFRDISSSNYARARAFNYNAGSYTKGSIITVSYTHLTLPTTH